jgi:hypothetical protein
VCVATACQQSEPDPDPTTDTALTLFEERILPIFQAKDPTSCTECHLSGVDLRDYIQPSQQETFASLLNAGLIDVQQPDNSKLLEFIRRKPEKPNLITDKIRQQEHDSFQAWIRAAVKDSKLLAKKSEQAIGPQVSDEVIRHARTDRLLASFIDNIWTEVGRCAACHSPDRNQKQVKEHGKRVSWISLRDPQTTLDHMLDAGIIDPDSPLDSLLLTKPTMQIDHGGGQKLVVGDRTYTQFRQFIDDYANIVNGKYKTADQLPDRSSEVSVVSEIWFKLKDVPTTYDKMLLQADFYRWTDDGWSEHRVATSDRLVYGKGRLWQHSLSLTAPRGSNWAKEIQSKRLPAGRYLVKLYLDRANKLQKDFRAQLAENEFVGQLEVNSQWPGGYGRMTVAVFPHD